MKFPNFVLEKIHSLNKSSVEKQIDPSGNKLERFRLENELDVLLIHNPLFEDSAAMLTVDAGSIYDPDNIPGLAHLVGNLILKGAKTHQSNSELFDFHFKNGGHLNGSIHLEKINFFSQNADKNFIVGLNLLINSLSDPKFGKKDCFGEIELIEHESRIVNSSVKSKVSRLSDFLLDESFKESRFINGNRNSLKISGILDKVKEFHKTYFKANRMKLVIKSKYELKELRKIAQMFLCIPNELENKEYLYIKDKIIIKDNRVKSLVNYPVDAKLKEKYRGKIIKFNGEKNKFEAYLYFTFPSSFQGFTSIHLDYIIESMSQQIKELLNITVKNNRAYQVNYKRRHKFYIVLEFFDEDNQAIDFAISIIYEYLKQLKPNKILFEEVKKNKIAKYSQNMNFSDMLETYSNNFFYYSKCILGDFEASIQYDEKVLTDLFDRFADLQNWTIFITTNDSNLPNNVTNLNFAIGDPLPILIQEAAQYISNCAKLKEYNPVPEFKANSVTNAINLPEIDPKIIHEKRKNGEYTIIQNTTLFGESCEITLTFVSPTNFLTNRSNNLFNRALLNKISEVCIDLGINVTIKNCKFYLFENNLIFLIQKNHLARFLKVVEDLIKNFKLDESEILEVKCAEYDNFFSIERSGLLNVSKMILPFVIKKVDYDFERNYNVPIFFNKNYYLMITAVGCITELEVLKIYKKFKSTGKRKNFDDLKLNDKSFFIQSLESVGNSLVMAYNISADSKIKELAIASILKEILHCHLFQFLRYKNKFSFSNKVEYTYVRQKVFLTINLKTLEDTKLIKDRIKNLMEEYWEIIEDMSKNDFRLFKKLAISNFDWKINTQERLSSFALLTDLIGIHENGLQNLIKEAIISIEIDELKRLEDQFSIEPIVIYGTNSRQNSIFN